MHSCLLAVLLVAADPAAAAPSAAPSAVDTVRAAASAVDTVRAAPDTARAPTRSARGTDPDSIVLRPLGTLPLASLPFDHGQVVEPAGVVVDAFGRVYVTDAAVHRLQRYGRDFAWIDETGSLGSGDGQMRRPGSVVLLGSSSVAVLDRENYRVVSYDLQARRIGTVVQLDAQPLAATIDRVHPTVMASDRGGAIYILDPDRERILAFDFSGRYLRSIGGPGAKPGSFRGVEWVATAPRGELVTTERQNARVQRLDAGGRPVASWPLSLGKGRGALPAAVDEQGRVAVADETRGALWLFAANGRLLGRLEGLARPRALAFDPDGSLLVAEAGDVRLRRFALEPFLHGPPPSE
jgi:sugar lactone lactonase YvrE